MKKTMSFTDGNNQTKHANVEFPKRCPTCNLLVTLSQSGSSFNPSTSELQIMFLCTNEDCKSFFIAYYKDSCSAAVFNLERFEPPNLTRRSFPDFVKDLSEKFIEVYGQAHEAKERGLTHIAGPGYRKAFEFLIKDYAKSIDHSRADQIDKAFAGDVVKDFISDTRVQAVAKRALWLGNDETHYVRKWLDFDVNDLIKLIQLTIDWIEIERESKSYVDTMNPQIKTSPT